MPLLVSRNDIEILAFDNVFWLEMWTQFWQIIFKALSLRDGLILEPGYKGIGISIFKFFEWLWLNNRRQYNAHWLAKQRDIIDHTVSLNVTEYLESKKCVSWSWNHIKFHGPNTCTG